MVHDNDLGDLFEEMDLILDCGVSSFDDGNNESDATEDTQDQPNDLTKVQNESLHANVPEYQHTQN